MTLDPNPTTPEPKGSYTVPKRPPQPLGDSVRMALRHYFEQLEDTVPNDLYQMVLEEVEPPLLETVMEYAGGNQTRAARLLGMSRSTLRKKLAQYDID